MKATLILMIIFTSSCSLLSKKESDLDAKDLGTYKEMNLDDFITHLNKFEQSYLNVDGVNKHYLSYNEKSYLNSIVQDLYKNNELFFRDNKKPEFHVIKDNRPFHFSLPNKSIFISSGLLKKYIKSEKLLYCLISYELIRSEKNVYKKVQIIPTGSLDTDRVLAILRLDTNIKVEIHKWSYYVLKRVGIDTDNYLSWLQIQNRNSVDFSAQLGEIGSISREEAMFKSFIIKNSSRRRSSSKYERSSRGFYRFINRIKG
jgi:hypothetical protein